MADFRPALQQLESYAQVLMAPPYQTSAQQLAEAQQVFMEFQKTKQPFELCRALLENTAAAYVKFQAAQCLKNGVIRDWSSLKQDNRSLQLLTYLFEYVTNRESLEPFVREQLLLVCAIVLKRIGIDERGGIENPARLSDRLNQQQNDSSAVTSTINTLLSMLVSQEDNQPSSASNMHKKFTSASFIYAILGEYASSTRASDFGMPWIKHLEAKKQFEAHHLKSIFNSLLDSMNKLLQGADSARLIQKDPEPMNLLLKLLQVLETILTWNFDVITIISSQYAKHIDSIETPVFQPNIDWKDTIVNENTIKFVFYLYAAVRQLGQEDLVHSALQCLSQVSSLTGPVLANSKVRIQFVSYLIESALLIMPNDLSACEVTSISSMLYRICIHLQNRDTIQHVNKQSTHSFCQSLAHLSCKLMTAGLKAESSRSVDDECDRYKQALDNVFDAWQVILQTLEKYDYDDSPTTAQHTGQPEIRTDVIDLKLLAGWTRQVFECYLRCHLSQPEGLRDPTELDEGEILEYEEEDAVVYADQLNAIGSIGRLDLTYSLQCLTQLIELRISSLQKVMDQLSRREAINQKEWAAINDDLHWLVMISSWTITQYNYGERDAIPPEVTKLAISVQSDIPSTVQAIKTLQPNVPGIDPVVRLIVTILKLCTIEQQVMENNSQCFSPQVGSTLTSFVSRFMSGYLLPNEADYTEMSMTLITCFGKDSPHSMDSLDFVIGHIVSKVLSWTSEPELKESSAQSLVRFAQYSPDRCKALINCSNVQKLFSSHATGSLAPMTVKARRLTYHFLVLVCSQRPDLWNTLFEPLKKRYELLLEAVGRRDYSEQVRNELIELCDSIIGISSGCTPGNITQIWSQFIGFIYVNNLTNLLDSFHNYNEVVVSVLELASSVTSRVLCFLNKDDTNGFYDATIKLLNIYSKHNKDKKTIESTAEEESYQDILLIMEILNDLAAKDFIDWFPSDTSRTDETVNSVSAIQVVFLGLSIIMPLMSVQLLEFPKLSQMYYKVVTFLVEDNERLQEVPRELMRSIMATVEHALKANFPSEIKCTCLSMLFLLAGHRFRDPQNFSFIDPLIEPFLGIIFEFTLIECGSCKDVTLRENVSNTLFMLICCFPQTYNGLVEHLIQTNVQSRTGGDAINLEQQLRKCFNSLIEDMPLNPAQLRARRTTFKQRFEVLVTELQGLLCIK
ncbi:Exportin-4 [Halotydeus destructor]|nr:Exportin-4 [Halotydeus destructor]